MKNLRLMDSVLSVGAAASMLLLAGCAHAYKMEVDAGARRGVAAPVSYVVHEAGLANSAADRPPGWTPFETALDQQMDVDQATAVKYVRTALSARGLYEAATAEAADMDVTYAYEIRQKRRVVEWQEPVFRHENRGGGGTVDMVVGQDNLGNPVTQKVRVEPPPPTEPPVDLVDHAAEEVVYVKELHVVATERRPAPGVPARVWDISISYEDKDPSMDKAMPLLAAAGCDRIGTNTNGPIVVRLHDKDEVVAFIKQGM
jgi:hypothetical protein